MRNKSGRYKVIWTVFGMTLLLAFLSYVTTSIQWDGGFPSGEFRIDVVDPSGRPVQGAVLNVYRSGTRELAEGYPLDDHTTGRELVSNETGRIVVLRRDGRLQFGGHAWRLFWLIRMGAQAPRFDCEITAEGFMPLSFPVNRLFDSPHRFYEDFPKTTIQEGGESIKIPVYEHTFTLEK